MELIRRGSERRNKHRFAIEREVLYKIEKDGLVIAVGSGQTLNMGSGGVAFAAQSRLQPGAFAELSISWPMLLNESCPMRLIVFGRILRTQGRKVACTVDKYEFRTQARKLHAVPTRSDGMLQRWADGMRKGSLKASAILA